MDKVLFVDMKTPLIDAGAGDGALSLAALRLGASYAVLIENDPESLEKARRNIAINNWEDRTLLLDMDLRDTEKISQYLQPIKKSILISNLGDWMVSYGTVNNQTSLKLIPFLSDLVYLIIGGYDNGSELHRPDNDFRVAAELGFASDPKKSQVNDSESYLISKCVNRTN